MATSSRKRASSPFDNAWDNGLERKRHRLTSTCEWIHQESAYQAWKALDNVTPILWINGPAGIGKTFLADFIAEQARQDAPKTTVLTSFCGTASTPSSLVQSVAAQLSRTKGASETIRTRAGNLAHEIASATRPVPYDTSYWAWDQLTSLVQGSLPLTLVVDGLDEVSEEYLSAEKFGLPSKLVELAKTFASNVRLLVVSRCRASILMPFKDSLNVQVTAAKVRDDVERFCRVEIAKYPRLVPDIEIITKDLVRQSEGIFIWASLAIKFLAQQTVDEDIEVRLDTLPVSLDELYIANFKQQSTQLDQTGLELRNFCLQWLIYSVRPMRVAEVANAISTETNMFIPDLATAALQACGSLIKLEDDHLKPIHHSLRDFLRDGPLEELKMGGELTAGESNLQIAKSLLKYLSHPVFQGDVTALLNYRDFQSLYPLAEYATLYWVHHVTLSKPDRGLEDDITAFFSSPNAKAWVDVLLPRYLVVSVLPIPPRPPINAQFFHLSMLKSQIVNYFEQSQRDAVKSRLEEWLKTTYESALETAHSGGLAGNSVVLRRSIELAELYTWLPGFEQKVSPALHEVIEKFSPSSDPESIALVITARQTLADNLKRNGKYGDAQELLQVLIQTSLTAVPAKDSAHFFSHDSLGWVLSRQNKPEEAAAHLRKALDFAVQQFGSGSPHTLRSRLTLAEVLAKLGEHEEAEALCNVLKEQLREHRANQRALPKDSVANLNILAGIYMQQGKHGEAKDAFQVVAEERRHVFGDDHRLTLWAEMKYGMAAKEFGDLAGAQLILSGLFPRQLKVLGEDHRDVADVQKALQELRE